MTVLQRIRILPVLILVAILSFALRLGEVYTGVRTLSGSAQAQEEVDVPAPDIDEEKSGQKMEQSGAQDSMTENAVGDGGDMAGNVEEVYESVDWRDAGETEMDYSKVKMELFEDLAERRRTLERREQEIKTREALLQAAEQELDQKYRELQSLKAELESLLQRQSEEEQARIDSLVKIYEGMKSKDAARIFNTLDIDILVSVMGNMSERKLAPILAEMNPDRARAITILLAQQKQLPDMPQ